MSHVDLRSRAKSLRSQFLFQTLRRAFLMVTERVAAPSAFGVIDGRTPPLLFRWATSRSPRRAALVRSRIGLFRPARLGFDGFAASRAHHLAELKA
jgi:hypothetical protein